MARRTPPSKLIGSGLIPQNFQDEYNVAQSEFEQALAALGREEKGMFRDYGFTGGIGEEGNVNFQIDPTANFGQYQQLLRAIGTQLGSSRASSRGRGLGKRGLAAARQNLIRFLGEGDKAGLLSSFQKGASGLFGKRGEARSARDRMFANLEGQALGWWNQFGPEDPDPYEGSLPDPSESLPAYAPGPQVASKNMIGQPGGLNISPEVAQAAEVSPYFPSVEEVMAGTHSDPLLQPQEQYAPSTSLGSSPPVTMHSPPEAYYAPPAPVWQEPVPQAPVYVPSIPRPGKRAAENTMFYF